MGAPPNVELEAAKFLQKLIHESTDEPAKLATKLYVILQHMKASGKENSMPFQVISRAMETVINQHNLDIEALMSSRVQLGGGPTGESARAAAEGCSNAAVVTDSKSVKSELDSSRTEAFGSGRLPAASSSLGQENFQGSVSQRSGRSLDHESPSSMDTRSTNSHSQDRRDTACWEQQGTQKDPKRASIKRKSSDSSAMEPPSDSFQQHDSHTGVPDIRSDRPTKKIEMAGNLPGGPESWKQGFKGVTSFREAAVPGHAFFPKSDISMASFNSASRLDASGIQISADRLLQSSNPTNLNEVATLKTSASRDTGKAPAIPTSATNTPFKEHHLKQLRAQCLVFLAFRNCLAPKRLHLEIALGNTSPKGTSGFVEGAQNDIVSVKGKQLTESSCAGEVAVNVKIERSHMGTVAGGFADADVVSNESESVKTVGGKMGVLVDSDKHFPLGRGILEAEMHSQDKSTPSALLTTKAHLDLSGMRNTAAHIYENKLPEVANPGANVMGANKQLKPDIARWTGMARNDFSLGAMPSSIQQELRNRNDGVTSLSLREGDIPNLQHADTASWKPIPGIDGEHCRARAETDPTFLRNASQDDYTTLDRTRSILDGSTTVPVFDSSNTKRNPDALVSMEKLSEPEVDNPLSAALAPSPKYTLSEKWIMAHQKRKVENDQKWAQKLQKADQRIVSCFNELKETVSFSEDISAKTRSVIELKKLQLLELQRRLRRNIVNDFFKPVQTEMDRLKSIKKHRIGRRLKYVEKYEQKMKEERQKRIRERQKEFFSEVEVHKERLEDVFKFKRERSKGLNRYVKEFHKRKERIHREKIDRIQREKINLLKINDVEGYLRMVQDAKSDRVKQLLKETEKYLLKLGSKLKEAKASARQVEMDENRIPAFDESSEIASEIEDENDQAKHYKESNEKYYMIAHSVKENITDQPSGLHGGKLREYQMNGLRWLVSLYNNHLNGILADEMGLGKTVQVISLLCYLMENKNDRGPFLVVVPSSVLPGWEHELSFWAPGINKIVYAGPPEERRKLFKEKIVHQKFNVLLTTYEYLMNKHDRPKLSKIHWHYVIIDEGHRIKNASCKLNADLKHYHSSHRLLLTGTPLQNSLEELWALLNFLLPNIFNSSEDFSQWFNKPFEGSGDSSPDEALLSEEENLLIINRLHQVLRPFVLRRLKHKVENELPEKIERLIRCEASAYQKLLMKRVEENLGALGVTKGRSVHNTVMELRNICNHPYLSQLHSDEVDNLIPKHFLPPIIRLCGKLEMLDRLLPKLKATNHRVLFFSTMTRLLDVMEEYLHWKQYRYLRLDGHTSGQDRGALIEQFNNPGSPYFIFLLSIRAGGVGVNLQAADTVIIFDTDWNPQVDLQAQARAHRIGQKKDVLVLRLETVHSVEEQVRAAAEHKLGVANQSITAGFFDNNTSAEDRREYLESLLRESKKEEAAPVLDDDSLNDVLARSESEIDVFEMVDQKRREEEMATWTKLAPEHRIDGSEYVPSLPSRLVTDDDLKAFYEAMKLHEAPIYEPASSSGVKRKGGSLGVFDTQQYGRGKRAREVRSYEEQWTEEEFEKMCQTESPEFLKSKDDKVDASIVSESIQTAGREEVPLISLEIPPPLTMVTPSLPPSLESSAVVKKEITPLVKRGRGRPKRTSVDVSTLAGVSAVRVDKPQIQPLNQTVTTTTDQGEPDSKGNSAPTEDVSGGIHRGGDAISLRSKVVTPLPSTVVCTPSDDSIPATIEPKMPGRKGQMSEKNFQKQTGPETVNRRGRKPSRGLPSATAGSAVPPPKLSEELKQPSLEMHVSVNAYPVVTSDGSIADGSGSLLPKLSSGSDTIKDSEAPDLTVAKTSLDVSLTIGTSGKSEISRSPAMSADKIAENPKPNEQCIVQALFDSSGSAHLDPSKVNKVDLVSHGPLVSIPKSSADSVTLPVSGAIHPLRVEADIQTVAEQVAVSSFGSAQPSSVLRPSKRSQKPLSGIEPIRRRGRRRGQTVSDDPSQPVMEDEISCEPLYSPGTMVNTALTHIRSAAGAANMSSHVTIPVVPVSAFGPSSDVSEVSSSMHHVSVGLVSCNPATSQPSYIVSGTADISSETTKMPAILQVEGQEWRDQSREPVPRRRGRKKTTLTPAAFENTAGQYPFLGQPDGKVGNAADRKVIATRSRQITMFQGKGTQEEMHSVGVSSRSKDTKAVLSPSLSADVVPSPINNAFAAKAVGTCKATQSGYAGGTGEAKLFPRPSEFPPVSSKGRTNVIVLALELASPCVDPISIDCRTVVDKEKCATQQNDSNLSDHAMKIADSGLLIIHSRDAEATKMEDDLSAPPGFEIQRQSVSNVTVRKLEECDNAGNSRFSDAKVGSVVLALESVSPSTDPSVGCQNFSAKVETSEMHTLPVSALPSVPESCASVFESASNKVVSSQPEDDFSAPPGFDMPQLTLPESTAPKTMLSDKHQISETLVDSAEEVREEGPQGPDTSIATLGVTDTVTAAHGVGSDATTLDSKGGKESLEGDGAVPTANADTLPYFRVDRESMSEASSFQMREEHNSQEITDVLAEVDTTPGVASGAVHSYTGPTTVLETENRIGHDNINTGHEAFDDSVVVSAVNSHATDSLTVETKEEKECAGSSSAQHDTKGATTSVSMIDSLTAAALNMERNEEREAKGSDISADLMEEDDPHALETVETEHDAGDSQTTLSIVASGTFATATSETVEKKGSHGADSGHADADNVVTSITSCAVSSDSPASTMQVQENEECSVVDDNTKHASVIVPITCCSVSSDALGTSMLQLKENEDPSEHNTDAEVPKGSSCYQQGTLDCCTVSAIEESRDNVGETEVVDIGQEKSRSEACDERRPCPSSMLGTVTDERQQDVEPDHVEDEGVEDKCPSEVQEFSVSPAVDFTDSMQPVVRAAGSTDTVEDGGSLSVQETEDECGESTMSATSYQENLEQSKLQAGTTESLQNDACVLPSDIDINKSKPVRLADNVIELVVLSDRTTHALELDQNKSSSSYRPQVVHNDISGPPLSKPELHSSVDQIKSSVTHVVNAQEVTSCVLPQLDSLMQVAPKIFQLEKPVISKEIDYLAQDMPPSTHCLEGIVSGDHVMSACVEAQCTVSVGDVETTSKELVFLAQDMPSSVHHPEDNLAGENIPSASVEAHCTVPVGDVEITSKEMVCLAQDMPLSVHHPEDNPAEEKIPSESIDAHISIPVGDSETATEELACLTRESSAPSPEDNVEGDLTGSASFEAQVPVPMGDAETTTEETVCFTLNPEDDVAGENGTLSSIEDQCKLSVVDTETTTAEPACLTQDIPSSPHNPQDSMAGEHIMSASVEAHVPVPVRDTDTTTKGTTCSTQDMSSSAHNPGNNVAGEYMTSASVEAHVPAPISDTEITTKGVVCLTENISPAHNSEDNVPGEYMTSSSVESHVPAPVSDTEITTKGVVCLIENISAAHNPEDNVPGEIMTSVSVEAHVLVPGDTEDVTKETACLNHDMSSSAHRPVDTVAEENLFCTVEARVPAPVGDTETTAKEAVCLSQGMPPSSHSLEDNVAGEHITSASVEDHDTVPIGNTETTTNVEPSNMVGSQGKVEE